MEKIRSFEELKNNKFFKDDRYDEILKVAKNILDENATELEGRDITDTPISPMSLDDCTQKIFLAPEVIEKYKEIIPLINNPKTAFEYGYLLVGRKIKNECGETIVLIEYIFDIGKKNNINNRNIEYDNLKLNRIVDTLSKVGCDFMSICHTHPLIPLEEQKTTIADYLDETTKINECIRDAGLNLSLQDIVGYTSLYNQAKEFYPNVEFVSTVIMYNGELAMFGIKDCNLIRYINIYEESTGQLMPVSFCGEYKNNKLR